MKLTNTALAIMATSAAYGATIVHFRAGPIAVHPVNSDGSYPTIDEHSGDLDFDVSFVKEHLPADIAESFDGNAYKKYVQKNWKEQQNIVSVYNKAAENKDIHEAITLFNILTTGGIATTDHADLGSTKMKESAIDLNVASMPPIDADHNELVRALFSSS